LQTVEEIRNPKSEGPKADGRPKTEAQKPNTAAGVRISSFEVPSAFGFSHAKHLPSLLKFLAPANTMLSL
jgi:hypothetical protein